MVTVRFHGPDFGNLVTLPKGRDADSLVMANPSFHASTSISTFCGRYNYSRIIDNDGDLRGNANK